MATKPTTVRTWATGNLFTTGERIGETTKVALVDTLQGLIPGDPFPSEYINDGFFWVGEWEAWLAAGETGYGSGQPSLSAHLIETDTDGQCAVPSMKLGATASSTAPLRVDKNTAQNALTPCLYVFATDLIAIKGETTHASRAAVLGVNGGAGPGVSATSIGTAVLASGAVGVSAGGTLYGVKADRYAAGGPAVYCDQLDGGAPARGMIFLEPGLDPTAPVDGDIWKIAGAAGAGRGKLKFRDNDGAEGGGSAGNLVVHASPGGLGYAYASSDGDTNEDNGTLTSKVTLTLDDSGSPGHPAGKYLIEFACMVRLGAGADTGTDAFVEFYIDGAAINDPVQVVFDSLGKRVPIYFFTEYDYAGGGTIAIEIRFKSVPVSSPDIVTCDNARIVARGTYG